MTDLLQGAYAGYFAEIFLFCVTCCVMILGLSRTRAVRELCGVMSIAGLFAAAIIALGSTPPESGVGYLPHLALYGKVLACVIGIPLVMLMSGLSDRDYEASVDRGAVFEPLRSTRAEFSSFVLFSITGLMLCAGAKDLIILFLALELVSLPTYVMVTISTARGRSMEAGVKYFFLGALGAAVFLYGFALLYGATGSTRLEDIHQVLSAQLASGSGLSPIAVLGLLLSVLGVCFKIAAVPMHFYTADVYQGAASPVSAFLAFVPKSAGFFALLLLLGAAGWGAGGQGVIGGTLPDPLHPILCVIAVLTMTVGNVLALLQTSAKRVLAYSSIAHSGYMLVGLIVGPADGSFARSGLSAVLFYLVAYGITNVGAFGVLACLEKPRRDGSFDEADDVGDLRGLARHQPLLGYAFALSLLGLLGLPPLLGFFAKLPLFTAGIAGGHTELVVILGLNSAIAAFYYLRLAAAAVLDVPDTHRVSTLRVAPFHSRATAVVLSGIGIVTLAVFPLTRPAEFGGLYNAPAVRGASGAAAPTTPQDQSPRVVSDLRPVCAVSPRR